MRSRRQWFLLGFTTITFTVTSLLSGAAAAARPSNSLNLSPPHHLTVAPRQTVVNFKYLTQHHQSGYHPMIIIPFLSRKPNSTLKAGSAQTASPKIDSTSASSGVMSSSTSSNPVIAASFAGASFNQDVSATGTEMAPPDTQVAVSGSDVVEAVNSAMWVFSKSGSILGNANLNSFFSVLNGYYFTDPRIAYDSAAGRWLLSGLSVDSSYDSQVYLAVSTTSDPTGNWNVYTINSQSGVLQDQPKIGFDNSVVVISWNDYTGSSSASSFSGSETWC